LVLYFDFEILALTALNVVMENERISVELSGFSDDLIRKLQQG
jgi:hypothetical protein